MSTAHCDMAQMRALHPEWVWNRSDTHVFLGEPGSLDPLKVVVEPGNSFSPGVGTYGVSVWVYDHVSGVLIAPELEPLGALHWSFLYGSVPVLVSGWMKGAIMAESRLFASGDNASGDHRAYMRVRLANSGAEAQSLSVFVVIRSFGPAGGPLRSLSLTGRTLFVDGQPSLEFSSDPDAFGATATDDVSVVLRKGLLPQTVSVESEAGWASGAAEFRINLHPGDTHHVDLVAAIHPVRRLEPWLPPLTDRLRASAPDDSGGYVNYDTAEQEFIDRWLESGERVSVLTPDARFAQCLNAQVSHMLIASVHDAPRISPVSYPMWWLRDGAYVVAALDRLGHAEWAGRACEAIAGIDAFGGFGAEGDGPGEAVWLLSEHYLLTNDEAYLGRVYPGLARKADLICEMLHTDVPVRRLAEFRTTQGLLTPGSDAMCGPASQGLIQGRMDWHFPKFWVNSFALAGLRRAADCARVMGQPQDAERWDAEAGYLSTALLAAMPGSFGGNERDITGCLWPTQAIRPDDPGVREALESFWNTQRCPGGAYTRELLWSYFELGQAHNYLFLGQRERTWATFESFVAYQAIPGLYGWSEGAGDENSSALWQQVRGWDSIPFVVPHGWTAAEMALLQRDMLLYEGKDALNRDCLVVGAGVPRAWVDGYPNIAIDGAPTHFGRVSWRVQGQEFSLTCERPPAGGFLLALPGLAGGSVHLEPVSQLSQAIEFVRV